MPMEKTVHELCLVCRGERWLPDALQPRSVPCPYCKGEGWVTVSPASLGENPAKPEPGPLRRKEKADEKD